MAYDLHSKFDPVGHKRFFINYLEVIILKDGTVEYAVPSHQMKLEDLASGILGCPREQVCTTCPRDMWCAYLEWLTEITGAIAVWNEFFIGSPSHAQRRALVGLRNHGLYSGPTS